MLWMPLDAMPMILLPAFTLAPVMIFIFIHDTHGESGHIVLTFAVKARHLCCFSTYESASGLFASVCDTLYDVSDLFCRYFTGCDIVQEKQRLCTLAQHVVDAHCHAVDAYGVMLCP